MPVDAAFILAAILLEKKRRVVTIVNRSNEKFPGYKTFSEVLEQLPGTVDSCVEFLDRGELMLIYPGGVREAGLSDENYEIVWPEKAGFGKVASACSSKPVSKFDKNKTFCIYFIFMLQKIIPIFTENCRDMSFTINFLKGLWNRSSI